VTDAALHKLQQTGCDVRADRLTRILFATDASIYQIEPAGAAFPRSAREASSVICAGIDAGLSITPRGAGTSLVGNAIGDGLIVDFSRHNRGISELDLEKRSVRLGAGVVLDQLNAFLKPHGFCFGPDVATSSRATIGGMIANNSSGARAPFYGTTADHVLATEIVLADGRIEKIGAERGALEAERAQIEQLLRRQTSEMAERWPPGMIKRWPGYGLERFLRAPKNLNEILAGSEGTLAAIFSADLKISPLPREKGLGLIFFASVDDAMQATVELLDLNPAAIEHIDRPLLDQTKGQLHFQAARDLMELDANPCAAVLIVEFYDENVAERLAILQGRRLGLRSKILTSAREMDLVWSVRKAGLSLLTGCVGARKPVAFIEDAAVRPAQLPKYVRGLQAIMQPLGLEASYYGHAASGLLHVRPVLDLHSAEDLKKFRQVADQTSALVKQFKGSLSAEHGVGIARTEYMQEQLGDELLGAMREIKRIFDPRDRMNPGKIFGAGNIRIDSSLRENFARPIELQFTPRLAFAFKDRSFIGNLEQCNGCGGCRKDAPTMCPTFLATGEEVMSTRGRANVIRRVLQWRENGNDPLESEELDAALSNCLSCKGCTPECPSNVNLALLKAELLYAAIRKHGLGLRERILSRPDLLGEIGCAFPRMANTALKFTPLRALMEKTIGLSAKRSLPRYTSERFDRWFARETHNCRASVSDATVAGVGDPGAAISDRGYNQAAFHRNALQTKVILWDDTFVRYNEPHIGIAAVKVLEALGINVSLAHGRKCCGRPAFSQGNLDTAAKFGEHNINLLSSLQNASSLRARFLPVGPPGRRVGSYEPEAAQTSNTPIIFLEPSCYSMFAEDYRELKIPGAESIAQRSFLFEKFVNDILEREPEKTRFQKRNQFVAIHAHCHAKSILDPAFMIRLVEKLPGRKAKVLETGCCGMAGAFGMMEAKRELSLQVAAPMLEKIRAEGTGATIVASGTSCRHQISELSEARPMHMAEVLAEAL
jgi:FAD/FMN-containing dehydrogenase/Fe-S oxidoreductase